ncbi:hypothetical protein [Pollutibacter soli]|uniref:hypothetical protein n=1 Tax=Pollutibacter soli TaxID=3034157 RepID=UPI003013950E
MNFSPEKNLSSDLWKNDEWLSKLDGGSTAVQGISEVYVFEASFSEIPVEQNGVSNYLMVNDLSEKTTRTSLEGTGYTQRLFLLVFSLTQNNKAPIGIYFSTSYNKFNQCIGIDPLYIGEIQGKVQANDLFHAEKIICIEKQDSVYRFIPKKNKSKTDIRFYTDKNLLTCDIGDSINIIEIIHGMGNMISGTNDFLFLHPQNIMNDKSALEFKLIKIIKPESSKH